MIWVSLMLLPLLPFALVWAVAAVVPPGGPKHARCLENIGRLESELFPELPKELRWAKWPMGLSEPGAIIQIPAGGYVGWLGSSGNSLILAENYTTPRSEWPPLDSLRNPKSQWHPVVATK